MSSYRQPAAMGPISDEHIAREGRRLRVIHAEMSADQYERSNERLRMLNGSYTGYALMARLMGLERSQWNAAPVLESQPQAPFWKTPQPGPAERPARALVTADGTPIQTTRGGLILIP